MLFYLHTQQTRNEDDKMKWMATLVSLIETDLSLLSNDTLVSIRCCLRTYIRTHIHLTYVHMYVHMYTVHSLIHTYICR